MANPRKFSEKIALHNQKQAEETAAFEQIMREVMGATRGAYQKHQLHINQSLGSYRGGSLPNVNQIGNNSIDLQSALNSLEDMKQGRESLADRTHRERGRHLTPHRHRQLPFEKRVDVSPYGSSSYLSPPPDTNWRRTNSDSALHQSTINPQENFHCANTPPPQRRGTDGAYMVDDAKLYWDPKKLQPQQQQQQQLDHGILSPQSRPKSCEVPGINIFPTQEEPNVMHVPISNNTGSLPDLTNLHFPSPLPTPLDVEDQTGLSPGSTYTQQQPSPQSSQSTFSPPTLTPQQHHTHVIGSSGGTVLLQATPGLGGGGGGGGGGGSGSRHSSPGPSPSPSSRRRHHHNLTNLVIGTGGSRHSSHQHGSYSQQQVRYPLVRHEPPWITLEDLSLGTSALTLDSYPPPQHTFGIYPQQQHQQQPQPPPPQQQQQPQQHQHQQQQQQHQQQSSTNQHNFIQSSIPQMSLGSHRSTSPADHSCSAPTSPVSHSLSPVNSPGLGPSSSLSKSPFTDTNYYLHQQQQTSALQHQLEQFKMVSEQQDLCDQYLMMPDSSTACSTSSSASSSSGGIFLGSTMGGCGPPGGSPVGMANPGEFHYTDTSGVLRSSHEAMDTNALYYGIPSSGSVSQVQSPTLYSKSTVISSGHQTAPQTPQTPTSIPDIILTGPGSDEPLLRQDFAKDIGSAMASMSGSFDSDLFPADEALRAGLDPIDFDGLQILTDPDVSVISDPATEETFRLERS